MEQTDVEKNAADQVGNAPNVTPSAAVQNNNHGVYYTDQSGSSHLVSQVPNPPYDKLGNPGPLGLLSFATTTFMLGLYKCGAGMPDSNPLGGVGPDQALLGTAFFFGGIAQFAAGMWEFRVGNTFGGTLHSSYGAFWLSYCFVLMPYMGIQEGYKDDKRALSFALGIYLIGWCWLTLIFLLAALRTNITIMITLFLLTLSFLLLALTEFVSTTHPSAAENLSKAGGAIALFCSMGAFYAGASGLFLPATTPIDRVPLGIVSY